MQVMAFVDAIKQQFKLGERDIMDRARVSHHTLGTARKGKPIAPSTLLKLASAAVSLRDQFLKSKSEVEELLDWARDAMIELGGRDAFARLADVDATILGRVLSGKRPPSEDVLEKLRDLRKRFTFSRE